MLSLAGGDVLAAAFAAVVVRAVVLSLAHAVPTLRVPFSSVTEFSAAALLALLLTGNYRRSDPGHVMLNMLVGSALGATMVCWTSLWAERRLPVIPVAILLALVTAGAVFLVRGALTALTARLLPEERRLTPAIVVTAAGASHELDRSAGYRVADTVVLEGRHVELQSRDLARMIRRARAEAVIVTGDIRSTAFARILEIGLRAGCEVLCTHPGQQVRGVRATLARRGPYDMISVGPPSLKRTQFFAKRVVDVTGASLAMLIAAPLCVLIAVAIRLDSSGPVVFPQWRVGIGGRRFRMFKFRTMRDGADDEKDAVRHLNITGDVRAFKIADDPRITRVGRFLRAWSLDELPQFLNVILGHMSLVGPRPVPEADFVDYEEHHFRRLGAKPGITGLWQVSGRSAVTSFDERVTMDTEYIDHWTLWLDFKILLLTLPAVLRRTGAY